MSWSVGFDGNWNRDIGYGVPAYCDYPGCNEVIDRGLSYVCGNAPYGGEHGCGLYFCEKHHPHGEHGLCMRCVRHRQPFKAKPDHPKWMQHKMTDPSWADWRKEKARREKQNARRTTTG